MSYDAVLNVVVQTLMSYDTNNKVDDKCAQKKIFFKL